MILFGLFSMLLGIYIYIYIPRYFFYFFLKLRVGTGGTCPPSSQVGSASDYCGFRVHCNTYLRIQKM